MDINDLPLDQYDKLINKWSNKKMAKFKTVGFVAKKKKDPKKSYLCLTESIQVPSTGNKKEDKVYLQLFEPRQGKNQSDDEFEEMKSWKRFDVVLVEND